MDSMLQQTVNIGDGRIFYFSFLLIPGVQNIVIVRHLHTFICVICLLVFVCCIRPERKLPEGVSHVLSTAESPAWTEPSACYA